MSVEYPFNLHIQHYSFIFKNIAVYSLNLEVMLYGFKYNKFFHINIAIKI